MRKSVLMSLSCAFFVSACCGKELARVPFAAPGTAGATATLQAGDVAFWTDIDIKYEGPAKLTYKVQLEQGGAVVATATCDPLAHLSVTTGWVETNIGNSHSRSGSGKMDCTVKLPKAGNTHVRATLAFGTKPKKLTLTKADLVLKQ